MAGELTGASDTPVILEKADYAGVWQPVDSIRTDSRGRFTLSRPAPAAPEIYRIGVDGQWVYIPVDSTETITISAPIKDFATNFKLEGSTGARQMEKFEKAVHSLGANPDENTLQAFRRAVFTEYLQNARGSVVSYYILTKTIDGRPIFNPDNEDALKYVAAVANSFKEFRPDDPRTGMLLATATQGMKRRNAAKGLRTVVEAPATGLIDISLPDENGKDVKLSEIASQGKPTVLVFSLMTHPDSPEFNRQLMDIYKRHGVNIYHVSIDPDQYEWREGARNIPWVTVFDAGGEMSNNLTRYNVTEIPTFFLIDSNGQLVSRAENIQALDAQL